MAYEYYPMAVVNDDLSLFEFTSIGPRGHFKKLVAFMPTENPVVFSLAFGDVHPDSSRPDDLVVTGNQDRNKILATVAKIVDRYTERYPDRWVYFRGSTPARNRLYCMAISLNWIELSSRYEIYGGFDGAPPQSFIHNVPYEVFFIRAKTTKFIP